MAIEAAGVFVDIYRQSATIGNKQLVIRPGSDLHLALNFASACGTEGQAN